MGNEDSAEARSGPGHDEGGTGEAVTSWDQVLVRMNSPPLGVQIVLRSNRRLETAMRSSRLPVVKTLAQFDFSFQSSIKRDQIESLHELGLCGPPVAGCTTAPSRA